MADIITEVKLPSKGKIYNTQIQWENQLRAPRLKDRGLGDTTRRLKLQANILDKTLVQPLGISAYDLHTADFVYLNMRQRQLSKGGAPYKISVICNHCRTSHNIDVQLNELEIKYLDEVAPLTYTTLNNEELKLNFITPRMLEECIDRANEYKEEYPGVELSFDDLKTQELLRFIVERVDGERLSYPRMTDYLQNLYQDDVEGIIAAVNNYDFGVQFKRSFICSHCNRKVTYEIPVG